eukprot:scaffold226662_cov29-Tisochrysis_lutea.AAC.1
MFSTGSSPSGSTSRNLLTSEPGTDGMRVERRVSSSSSAASNPCSDAGVEAALAHSARTPCIASVEHMYRAASRSDSASSRKTSTAMRRTS